MGTHSHAGTTMQGKHNGGPGWARRLNRLSQAALREAGGGRGVRLDVAIDLHKALTGPLVLGLMLAFQVFTVPAWIYLALHGSYGAAWVVKSRTFPDRRWQRRVGWRSALLVWVFLSFYWVAPVILVLGTAGLLALGGWAPASAPWLAAAVFVYALGLVLMVGADVQKNAALSGRGGTDGRGGSGGSGGIGDRGGRGAGGSGLITGGFFARTRHPNYLGEMMIYGSFALVVGHWLPWLILAGVWGLFFLPAMLAIDASLSRYPEYDAWRERTGFLLPRVW